MRDLSFLTVFILKIQFFWKEYPRHHRSGVLEQVSPVFHILLGLLYHSRWRRDIPSKCRYSIILLLSVIIQKPWIRF